VRSALPAARSRRRQRHQRTTDYDRTNYFETLPSNQLELALWLESDRMGYLLDKVDQAALANQQDVVRNERRQSVENQPYGMAEEALVQLLYPAGHPYYGNVIGSHEDIQAVKLEDVQNFFKQYYAPNNASLAIVGDIDVAATKALVQKYFSTLKRGAPVPKISATTPKITAERRKVVPSRVELPRVYMAWISPSFYKPGDADADITATMLGGGRSSRLYKKLVYEKQIAQDVSASQQSLILGSIFQIQITAKPWQNGAGDREGARRRARDTALNATRPCGDRSRAQHDRDKHRRRAGKSRWLWRRRGQAERLQPLSGDARVPAAGRRAVSRGDARLRAGVRQGVPHANVPRGR
jgi:predicted Zn-dependent peptidase